MRYYEFTDFSQFFTYVSENDDVDVMFSDKRKLELGLLSVYACKRVDQINLAMRIVQCLPHVAVTDNKLVLCIRNN